jgi:hypothetical protein
MKMKSIAVVLGTLAVALAVFLALVLVSPGERWGETREADTGAKAAEPAGVEDGNLLSPAAATTEAARANHEAATAPDASSTEWRTTLDSGARKIAGQVQLPAGLAADESLSVLALARALAPEEIYGSGGVLQKMRDAPGKLPDDVLGIAPVDRGGTFRVGCPGDRSEVWLTLDGRLLYLARAERIDLSGAPAPVTLLPCVGAYVRGRVTLPAGASEPEKLLPKAEVGLNLDFTQLTMSDPDSSWWFDREASVDEHGAFELRAVNTQRPRSLHVQCEGFATWSTNGIQLEEAEQRQIDVALGYGAHVRGHVRGPGGEAIAGAEVQASRTVMFGFAGGDGPKTESDAQGAFELVGVPEGKLGLTAKASGYLSPRAQPLEVHEGNVIEGIELRLEAGNAVTGLVKGLNGAPVAGAKVELRFDPASMMGAGAMNAARGAKGSATTGADGRFRIEGLGSGPFLIEASAARPADADALDPAGDWRAHKSAVRPGSDVKLELMPPFELSGRVIDASGAPVTAYSLTVRGRSDIVFMPGKKYSSEVKDAAGKFTVGDLAEGTFEVEAKAKGFGPNEPVVVSLARGTHTEPVEVVLHPEAAVSGFVRAPDGSPLAGAKISVEVPVSRAMARLAGELEVPQNYSGEDGSFRLSGLGLGHLALVATHADYAPSEAVAVTVEPGAVTEGVVLELRRGGTLSGIVYAKDGAPLAGGQVILQSPTMVETNLRRTEEDGTFRFERLRPGSWTVVVMLADVGLSDPGESADDSDAAKFLENMLFSPVEIKDGEETEVVLGKPPANPVLVSGHVKHAGKAVPKAIVSFMPDGGTGFQDMKIGPSDADGRYELKLNRPGRYLASVQLTPGTGVQQNTVEFSEDVPEVESCEIDFALPLGRISGRVFGPEGDALENARVSLFPDGGQLMGSFMGGQYAEALTDASGRFVFEFVRPGSYCVGAGGTPFGGAFGTRSAAGRSLQSGIRLDEGEAVDGIDFRLTKSGELRGTVRDPGGAPVAGASVFLRDEGGRLLERFSLTATAADGSFQYTGLAAGTYEVVARSEEQASTPCPLVRVTEGQTSEVELCLARGTVILVEVEDASGAPSKGTISVRDGGGREWTGMADMTDFADLGKGFGFSTMRIGPVPPGNYTVEARSPDGSAAKKPVSLDGSESERRVKLRFK